MPRQVRSLSPKDDLVQSVHEDDEHEGSVFTIIQPEDRKKWAAYLNSHHGVDQVTFYGENDLNLTIIAGGYVQQGRYSRYSDETDRDEETHAFVVSMKRLVGLSPEWDRLLSGLVGVVDTGGVQIITLPLAAVEVFHIILAIAHELHSEIPKELDLSELTLVAKASVQYSILSLLRPWVGIWLRRLGVGRGQLPDASDDPMDFLTMYRWLWISYAFGLPDIMSSMTFKLAYASKWIGRANMLPPSIYDHVHHIRARYLAYVTRAAYEYHNRITCLLGVSNRSAIPCEICANGSPLCVKAQNEILSTWFKALKLPLYKFNDAVAGKVLPVGPATLVNHIKMIPQTGRAGHLCKATRRKGCGLADLAGTFPCVGEEHLHLANYMATAGQDNPTLRREQLARMTRHRATLERR